MIFGEVEWGQEGQIGVGSKKEGQMVGGGGGRRRDGRESDRAVGTSRARWQEREGLLVAGWDDMGKEGQMAVAGRGRRADGRW